MSYAVGTDIALTRSMADIEKLVRGKGYRGFVHGVSDDAIVIAFASEEGRQVRFIVPVKQPDNDLLRYMAELCAKARTAKPKSIQDAWERHRRQLGRALFLTIKAKIECIEAGIETFDDAFMSQLSLPGGGTVGQRVKEEMKQIYAGGAEPPRLLPAPEGKSS